MKLKDYTALSPSERLEIFLATLSVTNRTPDYYVNWEKVVRETKVFEIELNTLNYLVGKNNIYIEAIKLFNKQPELLRAVPSLIASRERVLDILRIDEIDTMEIERLDFSKINIENIEGYVDFMKKSGLLDFLQYKANRSLVDYVYGVEAGLDSNARKNRSGSTMEGIIERHVAKIADTLSLEWKAQATAAYIKENWGIVVPVDKSERRFDVAIYSKDQHKVWLIETNYYGAGGSKLKSVSGEFTELSQFLSLADDDVSFVWVTDGQGWKSTHLPLLEAFGHIKHIFNLSMLNDGFLSELIQHDI